MMRLELFVDDKKLAAVLHAIDGKFMQMTIGPVHNAKRKNGKVVEAGNPTTAVELVRQAIQASLAAGHKGVVETRTLRQAATRFGLTDRSIYSALHFMLRSKEVKRTGLGKYLPRVKTGAK